MPKKVDISNAFSTSSMTVADFFQRPGLAFYIPLYQREYSWDRDNIDQLMQDIVYGVDNLLSNEGDIHFLGTIITVGETNPRGNIKPIDDRALPTRIDNIIDGQQRISSIALLATLLYSRVSELSSTLPEDDEAFNQLRTDLVSKQRTLMSLFSVDLERGEPNYKPIVIRGGVDKWALEGTDEENYHSDVARYLATFLRSVHESTSFPKIPSGNFVGRNLRRMSSWLKEVTEESPDSVYELAGDYPFANDILAELDESHLWTFQRPELQPWLKGVQGADVEVQKALCSIVRTLAFTHYFANRCCFTVIDPVSEDWAFDMFQSLNATGTPLTAIETFKPAVVSDHSASNGADYAASLAALNLGRVDELLSRVSSAAAKNKLTDEYLTTLAYAIDGTKLPRQFSRQRKWLTDTYLQCDSNDDKDLLLRRMGDVADYYRAIFDFDEEEMTHLSGFPSGVPMRDKELATVCTLFLHDSNHKMAHSILSHFYSEMIGRDTRESGQDFVESSKALAAFYALWRSAVPNRGLDNVYRQFLKANLGAGQESKQWHLRQDAIPISDLKSYLRKALVERGIGTENDWLRNARSYYRYDHSKPVCRFGLLISAEDTVADPDNPGLPKRGKEGATIRYVTPEMWRGNSNKSVEHVAPQVVAPGSDWDEKLYDPDDYQLVGNLTLLPANVNTSAGNKDWKTKKLIYQYLGEADEERFKSLEAESAELKLTLPETTIKLLRDTPHKNHMTPIVMVSDTGWNHSFVQARTERIAKIVWDKMYNEWLS